MTEVHLVAGVSLLLANLVAGVWGGAAWLRRHPSIGFWYALRVAQVTVVLQAALGLILVWLGREAADSVFVLVEVLVFVALLAVALVFVWARGALDWR